MKKSIRILAAVMVAVLLCLALASCGKTLSGEYYMGDKTITKSYTVYTFSGNKVTCEVFALGQKLGNDSFEGKYSIKDDEITFTWEDDEGEKHENTVAFEEQEDGDIKIGMLEFKKAD